MPHQDQLDQESHESVRVDSKVLPFDLCKRTKPARQVLTTSEQFLRAEIPDQAQPASGGQLDDPDTSWAQQLKLNAYRYRITRAKENFEADSCEHADNGDETRYANKIGTDTKGLQHNDCGEIEPLAWKRHQQAIDKNRLSTSAKPTPGPESVPAVPWDSVNTNLSGALPCQIAVPPPPHLASSERAAEAIELYWQALLRDLPLHEFNANCRHPLVLAATSELTALAEYAGPRNHAGCVTPDLLFRGTARYLDTRDPGTPAYREIVPPGVTTGPMLSQFALLSLRHHGNIVQPRGNRPVAGQDFLRNYEEWLAIQNGAAPARTTRCEAEKRFVHTGRDLAELARTGPGLLTMSALLNTLGGASSHARDGVYLGSHKLASITLAPQVPLNHLQSILAQAICQAHRATDWLKWFVHRSLRPEAYGGLLHLHVNRLRDTPLHQDVLKAQAVQHNRWRNGSHLLTSSFPEGAPHNSSYPGSAACTAAVMATLLKCMVDEDALFPNPVQPDPSDPSRLIPYEGTPLTIGGELNKWATNYAQARTWAGVHWRSDGAAALPLAEEIVLRLLRDELSSSWLPRRRLQLTRFDGRIAFI